MSVPADAAVDAQAQPMQWWKQLGEPRYIAAPMVLQSELAYRKLLRQHGVSLCYTPMITATSLLLSLRSADEEARRQSAHDPNMLAVETARRRRLAFLENSFDPAVLHDSDRAGVPAADPVPDRPLFAQLAANEPDIFLQAALELQAIGGIDAIDLNLGCPQARAKRDNFGAFLLRDHLPLVCKMVSYAVQSKELRLPITVKIRRSSSVKETVAVTNALVRAGASLVCVHGRPIGIKNHQGPADHSHVAAVHAAFHGADNSSSGERDCVPVIANGNIWSAEDAESVLAETKCEGVMLASALLDDFALLTRRNSDNVSHTAEDVATTALTRCRKYLDSASQHTPAVPKTIKDHLMTFLRKAIAPTWKREPNSGTNDWADLWIALGARFEPGRTRLVRRSSGKIAVKHGGPTVLGASTTIAGPPGKRVKCDNDDATTSNAVLKQPNKSDLVPQAGSLALKFYNDIVDEVERRFDVKNGRSDNTQE